MTEEATTTIALDDANNLRNQKREWLLERIAWSVVGVVLLAAMLGFLGPGPLGRRNIVSEDGRLSVKYYFVEHYESPAELRIRFKPSGTGEGVIRMTVTRSFVDETSPESITPEPDVTEMQHDRIIYSFRLSDVRDDGHIVYRFASNRFGRLQYSVGLLDGPSVNITQIVCP